MEQQWVVDFALGALVQIAIAFGLRSWARSVSRRSGAGSKWLPRLPLLGFVLIVAGIGGTFVQLMRLFGAVAHVDPSQKAAILAQGIAEAMNATALLALPGFCCYLITAVCCLVYSFRPARVA
jgi:hypothetical protein